MKRTTAGVNYFRIDKQQQQQQQKKKKQCKKGNTKSQVSTSVCASLDEQQQKQQQPYPFEEIRTAESILKEITADNATLRQSNDVHEKDFGIVLEEKLCEMRDDTKLVLVDIPGINESGVSSKYKIHIQEKWGTFDCVVVVMDGRQGVNTEEQVALLKFVKSNLDEIKDVPVIIVLNKIDDPLDDEQIELVKESCREIETIFAVNDREQHLTDCLDVVVQARSNNNDDNASIQSYPVVIPMSGITAFTFRCCSLLSFDKFQHFDRLLIGKLGRNLVGKVAWNRMSEAQRNMRAYELVCDPQQYTLGMEGSNFDKFLSILSFIVGGKVHQRSLIMEQIKFSMKLLSSNEITPNLRKVYKMAVSFYGTEQDKTEFVLFCEKLKDTFWRLHQTAKNSACKSLDYSSTDVDLVSKEAGNLFDYGLFVRDCGWEDELKKTTSSFKVLVQRQMSIVITNASRVSSVDRPSQKGTEGPVAWNELMPVDWYKIFSSFCLVSYDKCFCQTFSNEKMLLDLLTSQYVDYLKKQMDEKCPQCNSIVDFNRFCSNCSHLVTKGNEEVVYKTSDSFYDNYQITFCPRRPHCLGDTAANRSSFRCRSCSITFYPLRNNVMNCNSTWTCLKCPKQLDFNRYCVDCKVYYVPTNTLVKGKCPRSKSHELDQFRLCTTCKLNFQELPPNEVLTDSYDLKSFNAAGQIHVPDSLSDPKHFGHVAWKYCNLMTMLGDAA